MSIFGGILDTAANFLGVSTGNSSSKPKKEPVDLGLGAQSSAPASDKKKTEKFDPQASAATSSNISEILNTTFGPPTSSSQSIDDILKATIRQAERNISATPLPTPVDQAALNAKPPPTTSTPQQPVQPTQSLATTPIEIYDSSRPQPDGSAAFLGDASTVRNGGPNNAIWAATNVQRGLQYFQQTFGRNGLDGQGSTVQVVVNDKSTGDNGEEIFHGNGGFYVTANATGQKQAALRFGSGTTYQHNNGGTVSQYEMEVAPDLMIHEMTHGVIYSEVGSLGGSADEAGSVNEALADVMAAAGTRDWKIGEALYTPQSDYRALRNIANPNDPTAVHGLWSNMSEYRQAEATGKVEEHFASGILSQVGYRIQQNIGWEPMEQLFYNTITSGRLSAMSFSETAAALRQTSNSLWGEGSYNSRIVDNELRNAGL